MRLCFRLFCLLNAIRLVLPDAARTAARAWAPGIMGCVLLCIFEQLETAICVDNYPIACPTQLPNFGVRLL